MVRITRGTFGWFDGRRVVPLTYADGPVTLDPGLEERLVAEGVAEWADAPAPTPNKVEGPKSEPEAQAEVETSATKPLSEMTRAELAEVAATLGIHAGKTPKAKLLAAIEAAR